MHSKEFRKIKNGTGMFSHLSLPNSELFVGIDFSDNKRIDAIVEDENNNCFILYPSKNSVILNDETISQEGKTTVIFLIDSTWACAKKIMRVSQNITDLPRLSFHHDKVSAFHIKEQPNEICLSTIESIQTVLGLLETQISEEKLEIFLTPFHEMVKYQMTYTKEIHG
jgi:DTW domain-containing protein YfiP